MQGWSKLKKAVVISAVTLFGLAGLGSLAGDTQPKSQTESPAQAVTPAPAKVESETTTQPEAQPAPTPQPAPPTEQASSPTPEPEDDCDPNYDPCIPNVSYDLDCGDIGFTVRVIGSDPHRLDRDRDGYGCE